MDINLEYYKIFYFVAQYGSITAAAGHLSITQPAVSQAIRHLEEALSCVLFVRTSKGVRLTREGEMLFSYIRRGYEMILSGERRLAEMLSLGEGEICIGASDMTLQFYLLPYLERFHEKYPGIRVTVTNAPTPETIRHLADGKIDFGIVSTPMVSRHPLKTVPVRKIQDVFVAGARFLDLKDRTLNYKALENLPVMCLEGSTSTRTYVDGFLEREGVRLRPEFELATSDMLIQFAVRNLGIASVVEDFARGYLERGELFRLRFDHEIPKREFCIVSDERIPMSAAASGLMRMLPGESGEIP
ncbi:MAG: LysR family transcriptional regulator [Roseburia sp.]|jgi:DNA-binding transcriptional LysR family regulator|nr:LysR family transcriptional regulator [Roseburia sp.]